MRLAATLDARLPLGALRALPRSLDLEVERCLRKAGRAVAREARSSHDYTDRTGRLTRSILPVATSGAFTLDTLDGGVGALMPYASYVEDGTERMHKPGGYGYLRLAAFRRYRDVEALQEAALEAALRRVKL